MIAALVPHDERAERTRIEASQRPKLRPRFDCRRVGSREPSTEWPGFRDDGMTVDRSLLNVITSLQRRHGRCFASEGGLRTAITQDTGHQPRPTTIPKALVRLGKQGLVVQRWLLPGEILPDGNVCTHGTRLTWVPKTDPQRVAAKRFNAERGDRKLRTRLTGYNANILFAKIGAAERPTMPTGAHAELSPIDANRQRRAEAIARLRALKAQGFFDTPPKKPPEAS